MTLNDYQKAAERTCYKSEDKITDGIENEATDSVYRRYKEYCIANNFQALSKIEFSRQITKRCGFTTVSKWIRNRKTRVFVKGGDTE